MLIATFMPAGSSRLSPWCIWARLSSSKSSIGWLADLKADRRARYHPGAPASPQTYPLRVAKDANGIKQLYINLEFTQKSGDTPGPAVASSPSLPVVTA